MCTGAAIRAIAGVTLVLLAMALLGVALSHDPDAGQSWTLYPSYWSGR